MSRSYEKLNILIADDTGFLRDALCKILIEIGFEKQNIYECENGKIAFDKLKNSKGHFDIVLSDWNMPILNGLDFLKLVRASNDYFKTIPFVLITTVSEKEKIIEAINYQVSAYLIKPVEPKKLRETLDFIFTKKENS